ncbi:4'-phosphopantetheinyl transferase family protein [Paracidovorax avenae]|uniref:4'-phosphopantetheinyl transferase family protein n=1 Tax=Paracidovorax avenae TaxID=80867 RepID=UPI001CEF7E63|nr:4'-phosphopantetheinyl transferase superfamily protein [Paracidovorax avenae]
MPPSSMTLPVPWPLPPEVPPALRAWRVPLHLEAPIPAADWAVLSPAEADRASRLRQPADRVRSACTRAALRRLLGERLGLPPQDVPLAAGAHGRPALAGPLGRDGRVGRERLDFNVSHSGEYALIALAEGPWTVGVDVERCDAFGAQGLADPASLESLVLSPRERAAPYAARPDFPTLWTVKEAVLKCLGLGVAEHLPHVCVERREAAGGRGGVEVVLEGPLQNSAVQACVLAAPPGYAAALAWAAAGAGTPR